MPGVRKMTPGICFSDLRTADTGFVLTGFA